MKLQNKLFAKILDLQNVSTIRYMIDITVAVLYVYHKSEKFHCQNIFVVLYINYKINLTKYTHCEWLITCIVACILILKKYFNTKNISHKNLQRASFPICTISFRSSIPTEIVLRSPGTKMVETVRDVHCGLDSTIFITELGRVYACGKSVLNECMSQHNTYQTYSSKFLWSKSFVKTFKITWMLIFVTKNFVIARGEPTPTAEVVTKTQNGTERNGLFHSALSGFFALKPYSHFP